MTSATIRVTREDWQQSAAAAHEFVVRKCDRIMPQLLPVWGPVFDAIPGRGYSLLIARRDDEVVGYLPMVKVDGPYGSVIQSTPLLAYGGPACSDETASKPLVEMLLQVAAEDGCGAVTIGTPPFCDDAVNEALRSAFKPDHVTENFYQFSILDAHPIEKLERKRRSAFRNEVRKAAASGMVMNESPDAAEQLAWLDVYEERYREIGARPYPREFFLAVFKHLIASGTARLVTVKHDDRVIGGTVFLVGRGVADYFASAYLGTHMNLFPATWVLSEMFTRFIGEGITHFNWESSPGRGGVYQFKQRWGAEEGRHAYLTRITGDLASFLAVTTQDVSMAYPGCFVLPFSLWPPAVTTAPASVGESKEIRG